MTKNSLLPLGFGIVGFDLDGTLVDTAGDLAAGVNAALAEAGRPALTVDQVRPMIGGGAKHMLAQALAATGGCPEADLARLHDLMLAYYDAHIAVHSRPFPGAIEAVDALRAMGVRTGIATNKSEARAAKLVHELGVADRFDCLIGGDSLGEGKAKPSPAPILALIERCGGGRCAFVGDTVFDTAAARAAGIPSILVRFGLMRQSVKNMGADAVIDSFGDLIPTLERLS